MQLVIVQELVVFKTLIKTCKHLLLCFANSLDHKLKSYRIRYIVFVLSTQLILHLEMLLENAVLMENL